MDNNDEHEALPGMQPEKRPRLMHWSGLSNQWLPTPDGPAYDIMVGHILRQARESGNEAASPAMTAQELKSQLRMKVEEATAAAEAAIDADADAWRQKARAGGKVIGEMAVQAGGIILATGVLAGIALLAGLLKPTIWLGGAAGVAVAITLGGLFWGRRPQSTTKEKIERAAQLSAAYTTLENEMGTETTE